MMKTSVKWEVARNSGDDYDNDDNSYNIHDDGEMTKLVNHGDMTKRTYKLIHVVVQCACMYIAVIKSV